MKVTAKIKLDLRSQNYGSSVYAVQGDGGSRCVEAALLDGGKPWNVPAGVTAAVAYKKPDFTKGLYDKLADDTPAVTVSGSTVTVVLAKQMLTVPGSVQACIVFNNAALDQLTTFPFTVAVAANPVIGAEPSDDYIRLQWLEDKLDEYVKKITEGIVPGGSGGAVSSVNGKTGAVVLTADDVHALPDNTVIPTVPEKVSAFENDAGYLTEHQDISGKVDKVAGKGLSTHDYDDAAKAKVDAIPEDPKYTDTVYDDTAVVESLNQLKDDLVNQKYFDYSLTPMDKGYIRNLIMPNLVYGKMISETDGATQDQSGRFSTNTFLVVEDDEFFITIPSTLNVKIFRYDYDSEAYDGRVDWKSGVTEYKVVGKAKYKFSVTNKEYWMNASSPEYQDVSKIKIYSGSYELLKDIDSCIAKTESFTFASSPNNIMYRGNYLTYSDYSQVRNKALDHVQKLIGCGKGYPFLFFTDPHCWYTSITDYFVTTFGKIEHAKNYSGISDVYMGGDVVLIPGSSEMAIKQISMTQGLCCHLFGAEHYFPIVGNHEVDDNYGNLTDDEIIAVYSNVGRTHYSVERDNYTSIIIDSGGLLVDGSSNHNAKIYSQFEWIYKTIKSSNSQYYGVFVHIVKGSNSIIESVNNLLLMFDACNSHTSVEILGSVYDFTGTNKTVEFIMAGHTHSDTVDYSDSGIPIITTKNCCPDTGYADFDLGYADFDNKKLYLTRIGNGSDRTINIP